MVLNFSYHGRSSGAIAWALPLISSVWLTFEPSPCAALGVGSHSAMSRDVKTLASWVISALSDVRHS